MRLWIDTQQAEKLAKEFGVSAKELRAGQRLAVREALQQIQKRARTEHRFRSRSGLAEKSIDVDESKLGQLEGTVFLDEGVAPYASFLHEGTKRHFVGPKDKKALRWVGSNGFAFSKGHFVSGIEKDPFLYQAAENVDVQEIFDRHLENAFSKGGFR